MTRALMWGFFLADLAGIVWAVRVLGREARRHWAWFRRDRALEQRPMLELPADFVVAPARSVHVPEPRPEPAPLRLVG